MEIQLLKSMRVYLWPAIAANALGASIASGLGWPMGLVLGVIFSLLASFGFLLNDIHDRKVDLLNNANRLEAASPALLCGAKYAAAFCLAFAIVLSSAIGPSALLISLTVATGLAIYTILVRSTLVVATSLAAILSVSPLVAPFLLASELPRQVHLLILAAAWLILFGREVLLDVKDLQGDKSAMRKTLATKLGHKSGVILGSSITMFGGTLLLVTVGSTSVEAGTLGLVIWIMLVIPLARLIFTARLVELFRFVEWSRWAMSVLPMVFLLETWLS
jgi:4-hydroxybenzoate polyprenyltransferase